MRHANEREPHAPNDTPPEIDRDPAARNAGALLILTAFATLVAVVGRVAADADLPTLSESLTAISDNRILYGLGGAGRLLSGIALIAGAWYLAATWIIKQRLGTPLVPILFAASSVFTAISGACAIGLVAFVSPPSESGALVTVNSSLETMSLLRWLTGKIGFAIAGLALIVASRYQWKVGQTLRRVAPVSAILGIAMQFIWIDAATIMHPIIGSLFFIWLLAIGSMLLSGRVERHFVAYMGSERR